MIKIILLAVLHISSPKVKWHGLHPTCPKGWIVYADQTLAMEGKDCAICVRSKN